MRHGLVWAAIGGLLCPIGAAAQEAIRWQATLEGAKRLAAQTDRLVLVHFRADYCGPCRQMEQEVLSQPSVAAELEANYVPVRLNADHFPATSRQYGVTALPTEVILTPQGQEVGRIQGLLGASQYVARLNQIAASAKGHGTGMYARIPGSSPPAGAGAGAASQTGTGYPPPYSPPPTPFNPPGPDPLTGQGQAAMAPVAPRYGQMASADRGPSGYGLPGSVPGVAAGPPGQFQGTFGSPQPTQPSTSLGQPATNAPPAYSTDFSGNSAVSPSAPESDNPPLGLDGYCPVELSEKSVWTIGDRRWGARHRGQTYLFAGPEQQRRFFEDPDQYAPVLSGNDVVLSIDQGQTVSGLREHGVFFGGRVYLFADEASLEKFSRNPNYYANQALQQMRVGAYPRWPMR